MRDNQQHNLRQSDLAFFGAITASVTHEFKNCLAVINEYSGLLEDLLMGAAPDDCIDVDRIAKVPVSISRQVSRADQIVNRLNQFAHSVDQPMVQFELNELIERIVGLVRRLADMQRVDLEVNPPDDQVSVEGNPFLLQHVIYGCIERCLRHSKQGGSITITWKREGDGAEVNVTGAMGSSEAGGADNDGLLSLLVTELGARVDCSPAEDDRTATVIHLPRSPNEGSLHVG
ncbi:hypothetical protein ACFL59_14900 [Planctomycetota bacterium]